MITDSKSNNLLGWGVGIHLISLFLYAIGNIVFNTLSGILFYNSYRISLRFVGTVCLTGRVPHPTTNAIVSVVYFLTRVALIALITVALARFKQRRQLINETIYLNYENDLLFLLLLPIPQLLGNKPFHYFFSATDFFTPEVISGPAPGWIFLAYTVICLFIHYSTGQFTMRGLVLRVSLAFGSLILYALFFQYIWPLLFR